MHKRILNWTTLAAIGLATFSVSSTGCKSGWKMPSTNMFGSFKRKPDESTIAAKSPSVGNPVSPALRSQPNAINSTALNSKSSGVPTGGTGSVASYTNPSPAGAAQANGFSTGAYNTGGNFARTGMTQPASVGGYNNNALNSSNYAQPTGSALANNGMGGSAAAGQAGASQGMPNYQYGAGANNTSASSMIPAYAGAAANPSSMSNPYNPALGTPPAANQYAGLAAPPVANYAMNSPSVTPYNPVGNASVPPIYNPSQASVSAGGQPATASISSSGNYRPGSTGRATAYDLSSPGSLGAGATASSPYMPVGVPTTASGTSSPAYNMPPTFQR